MIAVEVESLQQKTAAVLYEEAVGGVLQVGPVLPQIADLRPELGRVFEDVRVALSHHLRRKVEH